MQISLYSVTVPIFKKHLAALGHQLDKAEEFAAGDAAKLEALMNDKLYDDMFPFGKQIEVACDNAKGCSARLAEKEVPSFADGDYAIATLKKRIADTLAFLETITEADFANAENVKVELKYFPGKPMTAFGYATEYAIPNFFFHASTAYGILRKNGVPLGKTDYITSLPFLD